LLGIGGEIMIFILKLMKRLMRFGKKKKVFKNAIFEDLLF